MQEFFRFIDDSMRLCAQIDDNGKQSVLMKRYDAIRKEFVTESSINCIHVAVCTIPAQDAIDSQLTEDGKIEFQEKMIKIQSSENLQEINISIDQRWIALKSWVQGIAEAGMNAFKIQSEIEAYGNLAYPFVSKLFAFASKNNEELLYELIHSIERDCTHEGVRSESFIIANLMPIITALDWKNRNIIEEIAVIFPEILPILFSYENYAYIACNNLDKFTDDMFLRVKEINIKHPHAKEICILDTLFKKCTNLLVLDLCNCKTSSLPESIGNLKNLESLQLWNNKLTSLPESIGKLEKLEKLNLGLNDLKEIPENICDLKNLQELDLQSNQQIKELPESIGKLQNLKELYVGNNKIACLPESIGNLENLQTLELYDNELISLPESIINLKNLKRLVLANNKLMSLPENIENLKNLKYLYLSKNQLTELPESIGKLQNLEILYLNKNQLTSIPESIENLKKLKRLRIVDKQLKYLPKNIRNSRILEITKVNVIGMVMRRILIVMQRILTRILRLKNTDN